MGLALAISLGFLGSLHCVGMCGPIAMMLPLNAKERTTIIIQSLLYQGGRIMTYTLMGIFMGFIGWGIALSGYQKTLSIALGVVLLCAAVGSLSLESRWLQIPFVKTIYASVKNGLSSRIGRHSYRGSFEIGFLNGFLPCGLVYVALAGAVTESSALYGGLYMALFGLGTLPLMMAVMLLRNFNRTFFIRLRKLIPLGLFLFGLLLIYRGLMLEVPLDLKFWEANNFPIMCH